MNIFYGLFSSLLILLFFTTPIAAQEKYQSLIKGRVVNDIGQPVENANIRFDISEELKGRKCWVKDNSVFSDKDGNFVHEEYCDIRSRSVLLYIVPASFKDAVKPIFPPFWKKLRRNNAKFQQFSV